MVSDGWAGTQRGRTWARGRRWADQHPEALKAPVDPTIRLIDGDVRHRWALPAGWVSIVNRLHRDLFDLIGSYELARVTQKAGVLRYAVDPDGLSGLDRDTWDELNRLIACARQESLITCEVCGEPSDGVRRVVSTRCERHPIDRPNRVRGATARPPGWSPPER